MLAGVPQTEQYPAEQSALDRQTALKRIENMDWIGQVIFQVIERAVPQPRADQAADQTAEEQILRGFGFVSHLFDFLNAERIRQDRSAEDDHCVPFN